MTKEQTALSNQSRYLITPSLLNSWYYYLSECAKNVREAQSDTMCLEDKIADARAKAFDDFINTLNRVKTEPNEYMIRGIDFENECCYGNNCVTPIIKNGAYQIVGMKRKTIANINFLLYGRLDVLKSGIIYDIKRVSRYAPQKYINSFQHPFYLELFSRAYKFTYLAYDGKELHKETYYRDQVVNIDIVIEQFINWLKTNDLLDIYLAKWKTKGE